MPHPSADTTRQAETFDSAGDALLEFEAEPSPFIVGPAPSRAAIPPSPPVTRATVSPRVAFVLGFLLATSMAWLVSRPWGASTVASGDGLSLSAAEPVLAASSAPVESVGSFTPTIVPLPGLVPRAEPAEAHVTTPVRTPRLKVRAAVSSPVRTQSRPAAAQFSGVLAVSSQPEGAEVLLNGTPVGRTPTVLLSVPAGSHAVVVRQDGYVSWSSSIRVVANQRTQVRSNLNPLVNR